MLQHHQRHDVARFARIGACIEKLRQLRDVRAGLQVHRAGLIVFFDRDHVSAMQRVAVTACHIPAAPAIRKRRRAVHHRAALAHDRMTFLIRKHGAHQHARHLRCERPAVAAQAALITLKAQRLIIRHMRIEQVKDRPQHWIDRGHLNGTAEAVTDIRVVTEINHARRLRADAVVLFARLGKNHHLRLRRDVKRLHHTHQHAPLVLPVDLHLSRGQIALQPLRRVVRFRFGVVNRRVFKHILRACAHRTHQGAQRQHQKTVGRIHGWFAE